MPPAYYALPEQLRNWQELGRDVCTLTIRAVAQTADESSLGRFRLGWLQELIQYGARSRPEALGRSRDRLERRTVAQVFSACAAVERKDAS